MTKTTPDGNTVAPIDPVALALQAGCKFSHHAHSKKFAELKELIKQAIQHPGFAHIDVEQDCPSFRRWAS